MGVLFGVLLFYFLRFLDGQFPGIGIGFGRVLDLIRLGDTSLGDGPVAGPSLVITWLGDSSLGGGPVAGPLLVITWPSESIRRLIPVVLSP